eukprot:8868253-Heterocapsa_arctica.AAC.1
MRFLIHSVRSHVAWIGLSETAACTIPAESAAMDVASTTAAMVKEGLGSERAASALLLGASHP